MSSKGGRPMMMDAIRYACGKINKAETDKALAAAGKAIQAADNAPPSPKVRNAADLFSAACFKGGRKGHQHAGDAIGQLWLLGMLDTPEMDETRLLNATRAWWHGRGITFKNMDFKTANFERVSKSSATSTKLSKPEKDYERYQGILDNAVKYAAGDAKATAMYEQDCLAELMETTIDGDFPSWVARIIQTELLRHIRFPVALLASDDDYARFRAAKRAMLTMAGDEAMKRAA